MFRFQSQLRYPLLFALCAVAVAQIASARDLRVTIPRRGIVTPVQRLNREGVLQIKKHHYAKAESLFYKAYLYDPADPFTLNNLGYVSELRGYLSRADRFYKLAAEQASSAVIDMSSDKTLTGEPMIAAIHSMRNNTMRINQLNVRAINLLSKHRPFEAESVLRRALAIDPHNPFTLNNLGVAEEFTGDFPSALQHFNAAAASRSSQTVVVSLGRKDRGHPIGQMAYANSQQLRKRMAGMSRDQEQAMLLTIRGVNAVNQNAWSIAKRDFLKAYLLDPADAFTLNNRGYIAERLGHLESAQYYYASARKAENATEPVGWATSSSARGKNIHFVAQDNNHQVDNALTVYSRSRKGLRGPIKLIPRNAGAAQPATAPTKPHLPSRPQQSSSQSTPQ